MIILNIKERGHLIEIPGMASFRTPATVDISKGDMRTIVGHLKICDIHDYEIIASDGRGIEEKYNSKDFSTTDNKEKNKNKKRNKKVEQRIDRMEKMIEALYNKSNDESNKNVEQKTNDLEQFQKSVLDTLKNITLNHVSDKTIKEELEEESVAPFIPDIDTDGMKIRSQGKHKTMKKDSDTDDAADALSKLLK